MSFKNYVLTPAGENIVAQATSANKIVFLQMLSSSTYLDEAALVSLTPADLTGPQGIIKTAAATNNVARIVGELTNQSIATNVKTVAITARLSTQTDAEAVVVAAQSDPDTDIYIPSTDELETSIQIAFNISINNDTCEITSAANVSLGDHERLRERTVTTHADGDANEGEFQSILGEKMFLDGVIVEQSATLPDTDVLGTLQTHKGITILNPIHYIPRGITIHKPNERVDACITAEQTGEDGATNSLEARIKTYGGEMGPYARMNVDFTSGKPMSTININAQQYYHNATDDYGPKIDLKNDISSGQNVSSVRIAAGKFQLSKMVSAGVGVAYEPYLEADIDGVTTELTPESKIAGKPVARALSGANNVDTGSEYDSTPPVGCFGLFAIQNSTYYNQYPASIGTVNGSRLRFCSLFLDPSNNNIICDVSSASPTGRWNLLTRMSGFATTSSTQLCLAVRVE